jgi:hypothetical protein
MAYPIPNINVTPAQPQPDSHLVQELSAPLYQARGWMKFMGILSIIGGATQALTIVGILYAWLPIWMGVLLYQAGSSIESAGQFGDRFGFYNSMSRLKTYFVVQGVMTLISIIIVVATLCILFVLPLLGMTLITLPDINELLGYY